ncbi:hypothetical protein SARC_03447 [Sphaeroforma arctica JP610]|uniref:Uncharacterized protein n=1 Tax=Sphaeroforma arctica JP610 TaxID=667725 RepID=A0A0L0G7V5_9EUKA|nr:hypothetical protein SARC_03447 [Sphaeroforma arctica JP610]KNC84323.1 hypothetical protein SARC_03447 [Sphaeroforma arctica JP610]|eukprot:XP_014158225.1 hypothetical protein SARC_03447 [Sphaeroforma arctica JP610]
MNIQSANDSLADSMEHILDCKLLLEDDISIDVAKSSGPKSEYEVTSEEELTEAIQAYRVRLRENISHYFPQNLNIETLVNYYLHPIHKDLMSLDFTSETRTTTLAEIKREITNRYVAIFEAESILEKYLTDKTTVVTEQSTEYGESMESCTPNKPTGEGNKRKADQIQSSVL